MPSTVSLRATRIPISKALSPINSNLQHPSPTGGGGGGAYPDHLTAYRGILAEFVHGIFLLFQGSWGQDFSIAYRGILAEFVHGIFLLFQGSWGQDFSIVNEWLTQNAFKIVFEGDINISLFAKQEQ